ncbi:MAG: hypothetical protein HC831_09805 [Chloroflexia bacterium]|nr:hypothetical protein [Chloroflexia bacterium]
MKDISKVEEQNKQVLIHFNLNGAKKWATLTKKNIGSYLAFEINQQIYSLPMVNAEIKKGIAIISGFNSKEIAQKVAEALRKGIQN